jgi:hypothetical protein
VARIAIRGARALASLQPLELERIVSAEHAHLCGTLLCEVAQPLLIGAQLGHVHRESALQNAQTARAMVRGLELAMMEVRIASLRTQSNPNQRSPCGA